MNGKIPRRASIVKILDESQDTKTFYLEEKEKAISKNALPGNFILLWIPEIANENYELKIADQIPMSISDCENGIFSVSVRNVGKTTSGFHRYKEGMEVGVIGPLGNQFEIKGDNILIVAGGIGIAPLRFLAKVAKEKGRNLFCIMGARTKHEIVFDKDMEKYSKKILITTDDGSHGIKGFVTDVLDDICKSEKINHIYSCGPEKMMKKVLDYSLVNKIPAQFSLERHMYCGLGVCGFCTVDGYRVCKDGPIFTSEKLMHIEEFGKIRRNAEGRIQRI